MKALTLHRPWDQLILAGHKRVENRSWSTSHRGDLLIHAGNAYDPRAKALADELVPDPLNKFLDPDYAPKGLTGKVTLAGVCSKSAYGDTIECDCGPWAFPGQHHWQLADPIVLDAPVPCRGFQQLWTPPADVLDQVTDALIPTGSA